MYSFVFEWTPALREAESANGDGNSAVELPYGIIFATFMVVSGVIEIAFPLPSSLIPRVMLSIDLTTALTTRAQACMGGSQVFSRLIRSHRPAVLLPYVFAFSALALAAVPLERLSEGTRVCAGCALAVTVPLPLTPRVALVNKQGSLPITYYGFLLFEVCVGMRVLLIIHSREAIEHPTD